MDTVKKSNPLFMMETLWSGAMESTGFSYPRLNSSLGLALEAAIIGGMKFNEYDFSTIVSDMNGYHWLGKSDANHYGEHFYSTAVKCGNNSFWKTFEKWAERRPFIIGGKRLHVGYQFTWNGVRVKVTSFQKENAGVVACSYKWDEEKRHMLDKVYKITHADIREAKKAGRI